MSKSDFFSNAMLADYSNNSIHNKIENSKNELWKVPEEYWKKILSNIMHVGTNSKTLIKRQKINEYSIASNYNSIIILTPIEQKELFLSFVPGGRFKSRENKIIDILTALKTIQENNINILFDKNLKRNVIIENLTKIDGIGSKQARNIPMDLYHPEFRNGSIPIDNNWKKVSKYLGYNWSDSDKHENEIIEWRNNHTGREIIKEDWEFDRLLYFALNEVNSNVNKLLK